MDQKNEEFLRDRKAKVLSDEILISRNVNAIESKRNLNIQRLDRAYHDLKQNERNFSRFLTIKWKYSPVIDTNWAVGRNESINFKSKLEKH